MERLYWTESYSVGVSELDDQHKMIIAYINELGDHIIRKDPKSVVMDFLKALTRHMSEHFALEERYFRQFKYSGAKQHRIVHVAFLKYLHTNVETYAKTDELQWSNVVLIFDMLMTHIKGFDQLYVDCFHNHGLY